MAQFEIGNKEAEKWTEEDAIGIFNQIRQSAKKVDINSVQAAILDVGLYSSGFYYLLEKFPVLESIKKDIYDIIVSGVNQRALDGTFSAAPSIWRMKQCGEKDVVETKNETTQTIVWDEVKTYEAKPKAD